MASALSGSGPGPESVDAAGLPVEGAGSVSKVESPEAGKVTVGLSAVLAKADKFRAQGAFLRAQSVLNDALKEHPGDFQLLLEQAKLLRSMGLFARAKNLFLSLHEQQSTAVEPLIALSQMSLESLGMDSALKYARNAVDVAPASKPAHLALAAALVANSSVADANAELNLVERKFSKSAEVDYLHYQLYLKDNKPAAALSSLEEAVRLKPNNSVWLFDLSSLYEENRNYNAALDALNRYLRLNPSSIEALSKVASLYEYNFHNYDKAIEIYQEILKIDPDVVDAVVGIDRCKQKGNDLAAALKDQLWKFFRQSQTFVDQPKSPAVNKSRL